MLLSVIVPVYNGEKYLADCLESLSQQGFGEKDYEVIVVNDGSTDDTEKIIDSFCKSPIFKKVNKINGGVSSARNLGIENAEGEYITFVDADDGIVNNTYRMIMDYIIKNDLDGYYFGITRNSENLTKAMETLDVSAHSQICTSKGPGGIHGVIYKKEILKEKNILFNTSMTNAEDLLFNFYYTQSTTKVGYTTLPLYYYRTNSESVTGSLFKNKNSYGNLKTREYRCYVSLFSFLKEVKEYEEKHPDNVLCKHLMSVMLGNVLLTAMRSSYPASAVFNDIKKNGLSLKCIKATHASDKTIKTKVKSVSRYLLKFSLIYKMVSFAYRHKG